MKKFTDKDPETKSTDIIAENIGQLKVIFPEAFTEDKIDFEVLKQLLGGAVDEREEKYGLNWHGKRNARLIALTPSTGTLRPCPEESVDWDKTQNIMIEGDNLEVLKLLQKSYAGKVKLIYIDPPYNTGNDFVYSDDFKDNIKNYLELTSQVDGEGRKISSNTEASGRFHTDWLNMMYPRLKLARNLLQTNGVLCVSIDDSELKHTSIILDEIFGHECFLGCIVRATGTTTGQDSGGLGQSFDYVLCYSRDPDTELFGLPLDEEDEKRFQGEDSRGKFSTLQLRKTGNADRREDRPSMFYPVEAPDGTKVFPIGPGGYESRWRFGPDNYRENLESDMIVWKKIDRDGTSVWQPYVKFYLEGRTKRPSPLWDDLDGNKKATIEVKNLLGERVFSNPKPTALIRRLVQIVFGTEKDGIVLDFFAGSGTTGNAVVAKNAAEGENRRFILVQLPEPLNLENNDQKVAADFCDKLGKPRNIAEICKERLRRAGKKIQKETPLFKGDIGFRVFKLDSSNIRAWEPDRDNLVATLDQHAEHLKVDRIEQDILYELLLKLGLDLTVPIQQKTIAGKTVHSIGAGTLLVCLVTEITVAQVEPLALGIIDWYKQLAPAGETQVIFRDSAFADDVAKTNLAAILQQYGLENVRSI
ncbi:site-specific DNA-methyltransferase [Dehalococcoides mccartyi]|uniref:site-specific DNA-methyltransferase n=1 Tax=Dehalococcoides mccartyi TaxID=61435 RepID=UPI001CE61492|nr:site-specific DNA-methyltransferase [Dehalococcoides mccartyi]QYY58419.1 site-specific DNA-methyltransferase [Dehalococcoides mccartyi]